MAHPLKIFYVVSEAVPYAKTGGLGDVAHALPHAIKELGHDIRLILPKYGFIRDRKFILRDIIRLKDMDIPHGDSTVRVSVKSAFFPNSKIQVYFVDYPPYFGRDGLYVDPKTGKDYEDNAERFALFSCTALEVLRRLHWQPDVLHCNDWQSALVPAYLRILYGDDPFFAKIKTLLTVHNFAYQGIFPRTKAKATALPEELFQEGGPGEFFGKINYLKTGIEFADAISTVSPTYAKEVQESEELGCGLQDVLRRRSKDFYGILNGVDYSVWDPSVDTLIPENYTTSSLQKKAKNKQALLEYVKLPPIENAACMGTISRLVDQKGFDLILDGFDQLMKLPVQYILLGQGEKRYENTFQQLQKKYPDKFRISLSFDDRLAHLIEAGCDMFLMPSRFEPCGLNQMYSLRYGTVPIVRATGGLADTVVDFSTNPGKGTGFVFHNYTVEDMLNAIERAIAVYAQPDVWKKIQIRGMKADFSWTASSKQYINLYQKLSRSR